MGYVDYVSQAEAESSFLISVDPTLAVRINAESQHISSGRGRKSVRLESNAVFNKGLFIFDILHAPFGCGTW